MAELAKAWAIRAAEQERAKEFASLFWDERVAAIDYLGNGGPDLWGRTLSELKDAVRVAGYENSSLVGRVAKQLWRFANEIRKDDWILIPRPKRLKPNDIMIGRCTSPYEYARGRLDPNEYPYIIRVDWIVDLARGSLSEDLQRCLEGRNGQSLWQIDSGHIPELESLCKQGLKYRNVPVGLPGYLVQGVDELVGERGRSHFIEYLVMKGLEEAAEELSKGEEEFDAIINPVTNPEWATSAMVYAWVRAGREEWNDRTEEKLRDRSPS